jgi:hypothetical protein
LLRLLRVCCAFVAPKIERKLNVAVVPEEGRYVALYVRAQHSYIPPLTIPLLNKYYVYIREMTLIGLKGFEKCQKS